MVGMLFPFDSRGDGDFRVGTLNIVPARNYGRDQRRFGFKTGTKFGVLWW